MTQGAQLVGFVAGGALVTALDVEGALLADAATFAVSAALLVSRVAERPHVREPDPVAHEPPRRGGGRLLPAAQDAAPAPAARLGAAQRLGRHRPRGARGGHRRRRRQGPARGRRAHRRRPGRLPRRLLARPAPAARAAGAAVPLDGRRQLPAAAAHRRRRGRRRDRRPVGGRRRRQRDAAGRQRLLRPGGPRSTCADAPSASRSPCSWPCRACCCCVAGALAEVAGPRVPGRRAGRGSRCSSCRCSSPRRRRAAARRSPAAAVEAP